MSKYFVSRQYYWPSGEYVVEIAEGGIDHASPDMLVTTYSSLGEGHEFVDPRAAVYAALAIAEKWRYSKPVRMVFGQNLDMVCADTVTIAIAKRRFSKVARILYERAPKCDHCGEILDDNTWLNGVDEMEGMSFCSDRCAERAMEIYIQELAKLGYEPHQTEKE